MFLSFFSLQNRDDQQQAVPTNNNADADDQQQQQQAVDRQNTATANDDADVEKVPPAPAMATTATTKANKDADVEKVPPTPAMATTATTKANKYADVEKVPPAPAMATTATSNKVAEMEQQPGSSRKRKAENDPEAPKAKKIVHTKALSSSSREGQADEEDDDGDDDIPAQFTLAYAARVLQKNPVLVDEWDKKPKLPSKVCRICGEKFGDYIILEGHFKTHSGNNPKIFCFLCPLCPNNKVFQRKKSYMRHLTIHMEAAQAAKAESLHFRNENPQNQIPLSPTLLLRKK
jgi:hypothetical protein